LLVTLACSSTAPCSRGNTTGSSSERALGSGSAGVGSLYGTCLCRGGADDDGAAAATEAETQRGENAGGAEGERAAARPRWVDVETGAGRSRRERGGGGHGRRARHGGGFLAWLIGLGRAGRRGAHEWAGPRGIRCLRVKWGRRKGERETPEQFNFLRRLGLSLFFAWAGWKAGRGSSPITVGPTNDPSFFLKSHMQSYPERLSWQTFKKDEVISTDTSPTTKRITPVKIWNKFRKMWALTLSQVLKLGWAT
jgi:hypothetical protein